MRFERVSHEQFVADLQTFWGCSKDKAESIAQQPVTLPQRATAGSAGYDFYSPVDVILRPGESVTIPTGIRIVGTPPGKVGTPSGWVLLLLPRSGMGFKYRLQLDNTVGVIDEDYYLAENEGHILIRISNDGYQPKECHIKAGDRFAQGLIMPYMLTDDDQATDHRIGGMGSTGE